MTTIRRYLATRLLAALAASALILALLLAVVDTLVNLDDLIEAKQGFAAALGAMLLRTAITYLPILIPAAGFIAAFSVVGRAALHREILALKAGGISPLSALRPVFLMAIALSLVALLVNESVTVPARARVAREDLDRELAVRVGSVWYHTGRVLYNRTTTRAGTGTLRVFELDERGRLVRTVQAALPVGPERGPVVLENADVRRFDPDAPREPPQVERVRRLELGLREADLAGFESQLAALPLPDLLAYLGNERSVGRDATAARAALHDRSSLPFGALLLTLLAIPLGLAAERTRTLTVPALEGAALVAAYLVLRDYGVSLAADHGAAVAIPWALLGAFGAFTAYRLVRTPR